MDPLRFFVKAWLAWMIAAGLLLLLFSFLLSETNASERTLFYSSSALAFLAACCAGSHAERGAPVSSLLCGVFCAVGILLPLLILGCLIGHDRMQSSAILSLASFTVAGSLFGSVFIGGHKKRGRSRRAFHPAKR